jgi:DNA-binding PadR family transcriptional regulator
LREEALLKVESRVVEGKARKYYSLTAKGRSALAVGKAKALELVAEIAE